MTTFLDEAAITGSAKVGDASVPSTTQFMDERAITGVAPPEPGFLDNLQGALSDSGFYKDVGKTAARVGLAAADMVLGVPGQALSVGASLGARAYAAVTGESRKTQDTASELAKGLIPGSLTAPLQTIAKSLGMEPLDQSGMAKIMDAAGGAVEKFSKGTITQGEAKDLFDTVMMAGMARGGDAMVKAAIEPKAPGAGEGNRGSYAEVPPPEAQVGFPPPRSGPEATVPTMKDVKGIFADAKKKGASGETAVDQLFAAAKKPKVAPTTPEEAIAQSKTRIAEGRVLGEEAAPAQAEPLILPATATYLDTGLAKVKNNQGFLLTPEEKISLRATAEAGGRIVGQDGKPIGSGFTQKGEVDPRLLMALGVTSAAVWAAFNPEDVEKLAGLGIIGATTMSGKARSIAAVIKEGAPYHFETMLKLPQGATEVGVQQVRDMARKFPAEAPIVERVLAAHEGKRISAAELHEGLTEETAGWRLTPKETEDYADYGLERVGRDVAAEGQRVAPGAATTTLYQLPEHMQVSDANHFGNNRLFGWTRSFEEDGVTHVVELQSDLAQHAKEVPPEKYAQALKELQEVETAYATWRKLGTAKSNIDELKAEFARLAPEMQARFARSLDGPKPLERMTQSELRQRAANLSYDLQLKGAELTATVSAGAVSSQLSPIIKNWPRRLIREALLKGVQNNKPVVRFASADTVAKVEGWPKVMADTPANKALQRALQDAVENGPREQIDSLTRVAKERSTEFRDPGHQSIYNRYAGEITRYLKGLGGVEVRDAQGHTWWEVPTSEAMQQHGPSIKMLGAADPELLAKIAAGTALGAYLATTDEPGKNLLIGAGLGIAAKGGMKGLLEADLLKALRDGGPKAEAAATELYRQNVGQATKTLQKKFNGQEVDIEAAVQDGMFSTMKAVADGTFRGESEFATYLHRAVVNKALNQLRDAKTDAATSLDTLDLDSTVGKDGRPLHETVGHEDTPANLAQQRDLGVQLSAALEKIDPKFRDAFMAVEADGLSYEAAAEHFGVPINTIRSRIYRAKEALQGLMKDYRDGSGVEETPRNSATPVNRERGSADPKMLAGVAAVAGGAALGAYLNPDSKVTGAAMGAGVALLLASGKAKDWADAIKRAHATGDTVSIEQQVRDTIYGKKVMQRAVFQMTSRIRGEVPEVARREAIYKHLSGEAVALSARELNVAKDIRGFYDTLGQMAVDAGVVKKLLADYATRIYKKPLRSMFDRTVGGNVGLDSPFGKPRGYRTLAEAEAAGHVLRTMDIAGVLETYSDSVSNAINNRNFVNTLKEMVLPDGRGLIMKEGKAPSTYAFIDHPQMRGKRVHPDIAADLRFVFEASRPGAIVGMLDAINSTQKRLGVSLSLFHAMALEHAMIGATAFAKSPARGVRVMAQSFAPNLFGESLAVKMIREGGQGDSVDYAMKSGLEITLRQDSVIAEERPGIYRAMESATQELDKLVPRLGRYTTGAVLQLNHMFDRAMWARFHTTMKLETFLDKTSELSRNNARAVEAGKDVLKSQEDVGRMAASFANDVFGGLNYYDMVSEFSNRWARELASAVYSPTGRLGMRLLMFAPDWTISTTRAFVKAFGPRAMAGVGGAIVGSQINTEHEALGGVVGAVAGLGLGAAAGLKGSKSSGIQGLLRPTELADLHRQYILRSAFIYTVLADTLNYQMSGHHFWNNKDPTRLDRGDGTTMQLSKHFMEPFHWLLDPKKQAMGKASFLVKETVSQLEDREYWTPKGAPRMGNTPKGLNVNLATRLGHVARQFAPISAQGFETANPQKAAWSMVGMPVYGKTLKEQAAAKLERKRTATLRRIEKRTREAAK